VETARSCFLAPGPATRKLKTRPNQREKPKTALTAARGFCKLRKTWSKVRFRSETKPGRRRSAPGPGNQIPIRLLKEVFPQVAHVAALSNPNNPVSKPTIPAMQATPLKLEIEAAEAKGPSEYDSAFAAMAKRRVDAIVVTEDGEFAARFGAIAALSAANKLASIGSPEDAQAGGLIGYGVNLLGLYRRAAYFVDRILMGAKPADLPIEQPTKFDLVVNLKTAKTLGLDIPSSLLARAKRGD
jgi:ABC-type uncharacterized transport system substrate-binding protein